MKEVIIKLNNKEYAQLERKVKKMHKPMSVGDYLLEVEWMYEGLG